MDRAEARPVDCFCVGEDVLVIHPDERIDRGVREPESPAEAIMPDSDDRAAPRPQRNRASATRWPDITREGERLPDADAWKERSGREALFPPEPGA